MNDARLDTFLVIFQVLSLAAMALPACFLIVYLDREPRVRPPSNGRWRIWYTLYGALAALFVLTVSPTS